MPDGEGLPSGLVDELLALPDRERQSLHLRDSDLLNPDGLGRLLDAAERLVHQDPNKARRIVELCSDLAGLAEAPDAVPRARYIEAEICGIEGDFAAYLRFVEESYEGYEALGMNLEALRTNVGRMAALLELGRYQEALDTGQVTLDTLERQKALNMPPAQRQADLLIGLVQQNRGGCLEYMGRFEEALSAYEVAEEYYQALGLIERVGDIHTDRGAIFSLLGRGSEALSAHESATRIYASAGLTLRHALALHNIGEVHLRLGNYARGLAAFEHARTLYEPHGATAYKSLLSRDTADAHLALNLYIEALATYRDAEDLLRSAGMAHDQAMALWGMGSTLIALSSLQEAEEALAQAADLFAAADNRPMLSGVMLEQASLLAARGQREVALETAQQALELVSGDDRPVQQVYAHLRVADLLSSNVAEAELHLSEAHRIAEELGLSQLRYRAKERLGHLRRSQGRNEEARELLEAAVDEIERLRGAVVQDTMRASFLRDKTAAYEDLLQLYLEDGGEEGARKAFAVAERAKSRALVDLLTGVVEERISTADPEDEERLRSLQADLNALYNQILGEFGGERRVPLPDLRSRTVELEQEISRLRLRASVAGPEDPFSVHVPKGDLPDIVLDDVTVLSYHVVGDEVLAFVNTDGRSAVVRNVGSISTVRSLLRKLAVQWDRLRAGREFAGRHGAQLERSARRVLAALHAEVFAPLEPVLESTDVAEADRVRRLAIVPHGALHRVPFHALFDGEGYVLERFEVSYAPSATVYALCQERETRAADGALVLGVDDPQIPAAATEANAVAGRLPGAEVRLGEGATLKAVRDGAPGCGVLHLACHGLFRADNPMFSALKLHDGWLLASDALGLDLDGALATLSACESGRGAVIEGDEVLGLARAFLGAGAATLVVSQWLVQDETTAALMSGWYEKMNAGMGRAAALHAAQLEVMQSHPHPYYWAPFVLIGKR